MTFFTQAQKRSGKPLSGTKTSNHLNVTITQLAAFTNQYIYKNISPLRGEKKKITGMTNRSK